MRETKFRAIDEFSDNFIYAPAFFIDKDNNQGYLAWGISDHHCVKKETVGQFIKILSNNQELFDGDIVMANSTKVIKTHDFSEARKYVSSTIKDIYKTIEERSIFLCCWDDSFSSYRFKSDTHSIDSDIGSRDIEIIGNIHQNPKLLK